jgi:hypothetical protein
VAKGSGKGQPKAGGIPLDRVPKVGGDPEGYLKMMPVWRFSDFDWDSAWGEAACKARIAQVRTHLEEHLANFETMSWAELLKASGGRGDGKGNNHHEIPRDKFKGAAQKRLKERKVLAERIMSLRLDAGTRIYGVRDGYCLRILWFDPHHKDRQKSAYDFG